MVGHIKLDRKILEWEWYKNANVSRVFIHLLLTANHKDGKWQGHEIKRGQLITGRIELSKDVGLSEMQIRTCLEKLKTTNEITIKSSNKNSLITICKYDTYQSFKNENNQQDNQLRNFELSNKYPTNNQQITTNNNVNNNKEGNKEEGVISIFENPKLWEQERGYFFNDGKWIFKFCNDKNVDVDMFDKKAKEFISDIELKGDFKSVKELQRHFLNWFNLKGKNLNGHSFKKEHEISDFQKDFNAQREAARNKKHL